MALDREALFVALFTRLQAALAGTVVSFSRRWVSWDDTPPAEEPALLLLKGKEKSDRRGQRGVPKIWVLSAEIWVYVRDDGTGEAVPSTRLNQIATIIEGVMEIQPGEVTASGAPYIARRDPPPAPTSLGGLCLSCEIVDEMEFDEGTQGHVGVLKIPIEITASA